MAHWTRLPTTRVIIRFDLDARLHYLVQMLWLIDKAVLFYELSCRNLQSLVHESIQHHLIRMVDSETDKSCFDNQWPCVHEILQGY